MCLLFPLIQSALTVPQRGIGKGGSDQQITQKSCVSHFKVTYVSHPPCRIPLWGTVMFRFGPFGIRRVRYFGIDTASILRAPTLLAPGGAFATKFRYRSVRCRNRYLRSTVQPGIEAKPEHRGEPTVLSCGADLLRGRLTCF